MKRKVYALIIGLVFSVSLILNEGFIGQEGLYTIRAADEEMSEGQEDNAVSEGAIGGQEDDSQQEKEPSLKDITKNLEAYTVPFVSISQDLKSASADKKQLVIRENELAPYRIKLKKAGALNFKMQMVSPLKKGEIVILKVYQNKDFSSPVLYKKLENKQDVMEFVNLFPKGTYDFIFSLEGTSTAYANMNFFSYCMSDFTASVQNENYIGYGNNQNIYIKVKAKAAGVLKFSTAIKVTDIQSSDGFTGMNYELCDSYKNPLGRGTTDAQQAYNVSYGVKKGVYYIKITPTAGIFKFSYEFKEYPGSKNTEKGKAYRLKKGQARYQTFSVGYRKNTQYWYKFTIKKPSYITLQMEFDGRGGIVQAALYKNNHMVKLGASSLIECRSGEIESLKWQDEEGISDKWPAGTYYLRIGKNEDAANGVVKLLIT